MFLSIKSIPKVSWSSNDPLNFKPKMFNYGRVYTKKNSGEDKEFISKFMTKSGQTIFKPALAKDIFSKEDFVDNAPQK